AIGVSLLYRGPVVEQAEALFADKGRAAAPAPSRQQVSAPKTENVLLREKGGEQPSLLAVDEPADSSVTDEKKMAAPTLADTASERGRSADWADKSAMAEKASPAEPKSDAGGVDDGSDVDAARAARGVVVGPSAAVGADVSEQPVEARTDESLLAREEERARRESAPLSPGPAPVPAPAPSDETVVGGGVDDDREGRLEGALEKNLDYEVAARLAPGAADQKRARIVTQEVKEKVEEQERARAAAAPAQGASGLMARSDAESRDVEGFMPVSPAPPTCRALRKIPAPLSIRPDATAEFFEQLSIWPTQLGVLIEPDPAKELFTLTVTRAQWPRLAEQLTRLSLSPPQAAELPAKADCVSVDVRAVSIP
ncbi:MAG: hypothetical protein JSV80_10745, partial [Acidobacteriota bacterium]